MAEEYDNKNSGAVFQPFPNNDFILEGKLDIEGSEHKIVMIRSMTKAGRVIIKCYTELCALFENDNALSASPDYTGNCHERFEINPGTKLRLAAWKKQHSGNKNYLSLQVSENKRPADQPSTKEEPAKILDDEIPF